MLGRKQTEINCLKAVNEELRADVRHHLDRQLALARDLDECASASTKLVRDLREMDQLVYQMSQSGSAEQLRSAVARAWAITEERMKAESARIADLLIPEIKKVYTDESQRPAIPTKHSPQEAPTPQRQLSRSAPRSSQD